MGGRGGWVFGVLVFGLGFFQLLLFVCLFGVLVFVCFPFYSCLFILGIGFVVVLFFVGVFWLHQVKPEKLVFLDTELHPSSPSSPYDIPFHSF